MKPTQLQREKLVHELRRRKATAGLSQGQLSALAGIDASQTSRILDGQFRTLSGGVMRICKALGVDPQDADRSPAAEPAKTCAAWARLEASVRRAWDQTPQGADRLVAVIDAVARVGVHRMPSAKAGDPPPEPADK